MSFNIVCDSCTDLTKEDFEKGCYTWIPLTLLIGDEEIVDDDTFDQHSFLEKVANSKGACKSACPAPEAYMEAYKKADDIYVVTLSAELSGSYNSAELGKKLYEEELGEKNIHVFNSRGASSTQLLIARKIYEYASQGMSFEQVVEKVEDYIRGQRTFFVLETLDVLQRNGRLSKVNAVLATALNIKPVMEGTKEGNIQKLAQARGTKKALAKMAECIVKEGQDLTERILAIAHCNCYERAVYLKKLLEDKLEVKEIVIVDTKGVSSLYACDGGVVVAY